VTNNGLAVAPAAEFVVLLPAGLRLENAVSTRGTCTAGPRCSLGALAPGDVVTVRVVATGIAAGAQIVSGALSGRASEADPRNDHATVTITVADAVKPPERPGSLSITSTVDPNPGYVGGDTIVVTYTLHNGAPVAMPAVTLATSLPAVLLPPTSVSPGCAPSGASCALGVLQPGQTVDARITVAAKSAVDSAVSATVTTTGPDSDPGDNTATARLVIRRPVLTVDPGVGPPGFVVRATGTDFPPGATIRLAWTIGISQTPGELKAGADGRFDTQVLIFHHDQLGVRSLTGTSSNGPRFGAVLSNPFLVVPGAQQPPFVQRE
jgi:hypothetical protein